MPHLLRQQARTLEALLMANLLTGQDPKAHYLSIHTHLTNLHRTGRALAAEHLYISFLPSR